MSDLAEKIIEQQAKERGGLEKDDPPKKPEFFKQSLPEKDDLGIPTANCLEYVIARILYIDYHFGNKEHLHLRNDDSRIWEGDHWVAENSKNLYRLLRWKGQPISRDRIEMVWTSLRDYIPTLDESKLVVKNNLMFDRVSGEMYLSENKPLTIN